jgi:hypothetical protein
MRVYVNGESGGKIFHIPVIFPLTGWSAFFILHHQAAVGFFLESKHGQDEPEKGGQNGHH